MTSSSATPNTPIAEQRDVEPVEQAEDVEGEALGAVDRVLADGREQEPERDHQQRVDLRARRELRHQQQAEQHQRGVFRGAEGEREVGERGADHEQRGRHDARRR